MLTPLDQYAIVVELLRDGFSLTAQQMRWLQGWYVYSFIRDGEVMYTGVKTSDGERPFNPDHHALGWKVCDPRRQRGATDVPAVGDELMIYPMPGPGAARWAEKVMLAEVPGKWNKRLWHADTWTQFPGPNETSELAPVVNERAGLDLALQ